MKYLLGMVLVFIHPGTEIIKQSINCEAHWVVMLSCCLDLDVLDAQSYEGYTNRHHSLKAVGSFVHPRHEQQKYLYFSNYPVYRHLSAVSPQTPGLHCYLSCCVKYKCSKTRNVYLKVGFSSSLLLILLSS